ncbi:MAG: GGDEF domain-containing protein, partial [Pseudomonadota bacterium]
RVNDDFGHLAGDYVLKKVANEVSRRIRKEECFARYGGEEFTIVLPDTTLDRGKILAEKVRSIIEATTFEFEDNIIPVTVSMGLTQMLEDDKEAPPFIKRADEMLYAAKEGGRNCIKF